MDYKISREEFNSVEREKPTIYINEKRKYFIMKFDKGPNPYTASKQGLEYASTITFALYVGHLNEDLTPNLNSSILIKDFLTSEKANQNVYGLYMTNGGGLIDLGNNTLDVNEIRISDWKELNIIFPR
jgi:hypothetical protein